MRIGFALPQWGAQARHADRIAGFAGEAERLGAASLWVGDRLIAPVDPSVGYGGGPGIPAEFNARLDPFALLTVAATATESALLGTNVLNLPWYPPAFLARSLTTIDLLSGGRLLPGFGIGWSPEEYTAMGIPFRDRGHRLDEGLDALATLTRDDPAEHHGKHWQVPRTHVGLTARLPVYLGGYSTAALRRVGARADGWLPAILVGRKNLAQLLAGQRAPVDDAARAAGRDPSTVDTVLRVNAPRRATLPMITDTIAEVVQATGIDHVFVDFAYLAEHPDQALELAATVLSTLR